MRLTRWQGIGLLFAALLLSLLAVAHAAAPPTCSDAEKAFDGGRFTEAANEYIAVIAEDPDSDCVDKLLDSVVQLCVHADWLKARNHPEAAAEAYAAIFKLEPVVGQWTCDEGDEPPPGEKGDKGDTGDTGAKGEEGDKGDTGDKGKTGDTGAKGDEGDKGDPGAKGARGDKGDKGDRGPPGRSVLCCPG